MTAWISITSIRRHLTCPMVLSIAILLFATLMVDPASSGYTRVNAPSASDPMDVHIYQLDNGLTVYLTENHETPRFYAEIIVRAGSKNDPAEATGLAHYLEHMLFKGTRNIGTLDYEQERVHLDRIVALYEEHYRESEPDKRAAIYEQINRESQLAAQYAIPNELDRLYNAMGGGGVNAHTSNEETVYKVNLPSNRLRQWATIEAERFHNPVFRLFQPELEVVYEEKNRSMDSKDRLIYYAVLDQLFKEHPYGQQPTIGTVDHLKNPSLQHMYDFYHTYYVPNNMAIAISGDIEIENTIGIIDDHFSAWESKPLPAMKVWEEKPLQGAERVEVQYLGEEYVMLAFRTVPSTHDDVEALTLVDMTLANSTAGLIDLNLNQQQKVRNASASSSIYGVQNDYGFQYLYGIPKQDQSLEEVEQLLLDQLELLKQGQFEDWIIPAIINDFKQSQKAGLEQNGSRVSWMRNAFLSYEKWEETVTSLDRMSRLTKEDVVRAANKYFGSDYVAGYRRDAQHEIPQIDKPSIDKIDIDPTRISTFADGVLKLPVDEIEPVFVDPATDYRLMDYQEGVKIYYAQNPLNDLFSFSISFDVGRRFEDRLGAAAMFLDRSGTGLYSPGDLKKEWYKLGTSFGISAGDSRTSIRISGLEENFEASLALMLDYVQHPEASQSTLDELLKIVLVSREDARKNPRSIHSALVQYNMYGPESSYLRMTPNAALQQSTVAELHGLIKDLFSYEHTISFTGQMPLEELVATLRKHYSLAENLKPAPPYQFLKTRRPEQTEIMFVHKEMAQAQVRIDFGSDVFDESINPAIQLYNGYFGGDMSSIVFQELREARALAYSADGAYVAGGRKDDENRMVGVITTQADKTSDAVAAFIDLMDNLPESAERFDASRQSILNRYRTSKLGFRSVLGAVRSWERLELPIDPRRQRYEKIKQADMGLMLDFHTEVIQGRPKLISIVGDRGKIDLTALAELGRVTEVSLDQLFVF